MTILHQRGIVLRPRSIAVVFMLVAVSPWGFGLPAASQGEPPNDSISTAPGAVDTLGLAEYSPDELRQLRAAALPGEQPDPWRSGSSAAELWIGNAGQNLSAQRSEAARLLIERDAAAGRTVVSGEALVSSTNREAVVEARLRSLVVDAFVNGESDALDKMAGSQERLYIDTPVRSATESLSATRQRLEDVTNAHRDELRRRRDRSELIADQSRLQQYVVDEAVELDATARRFALDHAASLRDRVDQTLAVSGEAPETVLVGGFRVSPEIAGPLADMLAAAAEDEIFVEGWGYRSTEEQINLRDNHCGDSGFAIFDGPSPACSPPTARPLHSEHEKGLAIDFTENGAILTQASPAFAWLRENAATYGFFNLPSEAWHWSTTGH